MNILIVGAGAVGKVYGRHLSMGGAQVSFFVKEKYAEAARSGFYFYPLNEPKHRTHPIYWSRFRVISSTLEVQKEKWDYVILTMSSPALRAVWLDEFLKSIPNTPVVTLQPGFIDKEYLLARIPAQLVIDGTIHVVSHEATLNEEHLPKPGTAYWIPPASHSAFSGETKLLRPLLTVFRKGGFSVKNVADARKENVVAGPALTLAVLALEKSNWVFTEFVGSNGLKLACLAMPEAIAIQAKKSGVKTPLSFFLKPIFFRGIVKSSPIVMPFDFEKHLKTHFTKVRDQMHEFLDQWIEYGRQEKLGVDALKKFRESLSSPNGH